MKDHEESKELIAAVRAALSKAGQIVPTSAEEVDDLESVIAEEGVDIPDHLKAENIVLQMGVNAQNIATPFPRPIEIPSAPGLVRAARKGSEISDAMNNKMRADKAKKNESGSK